MITENFLIECDIDGRSFFRAIPEGRDGSFRLEVSMREAGKTVLPLVITGKVLPNNQLQLEVDMAKDFQPDTMDPHQRAIQILKTTP